MKPVLFYSRYHVLFQLRKTVDKNEFQSSTWQRGLHIYFFISLSQKCIYSKSCSIQEAFGEEGERYRSLCMWDKGALFNFHLTSQYCVVIFSVRSKMKRLPAKPRIVHGSVFGSVFRGVTKYLVYDFFHELFVYVWCNTHRMAPETAIEIKKELKFQSQNRVQTERGAELKVWVSEWIENGAHNSICETKGEPCRRKPTSAIKCPSLHSYGHN